MWSAYDLKISYLTAFCQVGTISIILSELAAVYSSTKGRTIRKLMGGAGEVQKKNSRKGKLNEKKFLQAN